MQTRAFVEEWQLSRPFRTAKIERLHVRVLRVEAQRGGHLGQGESFCHEAFGVEIEDAAEAVERVRDEAEALAMPAGPARDALISALWDLRAKERSERAWEQLEPTLKPVPTLFTIGIDEIDKMEARAREHAGWPVLKIKSEAAKAIERVAAVRRGAPDAELIVDANASWSVADYKRLAPQLAEAGVALLEQPLDPHHDEALEQLPRPLPLCADESLRTRDDLHLIKHRYDMINIKLPKCGGLDNALTLRDDARQCGLGIFVGCMVSTSLSIAPALLVAQGATYVDLDGPLHLKQDRTPALEYRHSPQGCVIMPPDRALWG